jgi:membrane associated rhomboid family serine protease
VAGFFNGLPKFHRGALAIFLITAAATGIVGDQPLGDALRLHPGALLSGAGIWQPLTANFIFPADSVGFLIGTLFVQWFFGSSLEEFWGTRKYVVLIVGCGTAGYLVHALLSPLLPPVVGCGSTGMDVATLTAFGLVFRKRMLAVMGVMPVKASTLVLILVPAIVLSPLLRGAPWPLAIAPVVAIAGAWLATAQPWRRGAGGSGGSGGGPTRTPARKPKTNRAKPSHLRVVKDDLPN